jgi:hypothetical protein
VLPAIERQVHLVYVLVVLRHRCRIEGNLKRACVRVYFWNCKPVTNFALARNGTIKAARLLCERLVQAGCGGSCANQDVGRFSKVSIRRQLARCRPETASTLLDV